MCGIVGVFQRNGAVPEQGLLSAMCRRLAHRGPDGEGILRATVHEATGQSAGFGHRRLAILDTSSNGSQPMTNARRDVMLVFNGELFNFQTLRQRLEQAGHRFRSTSDTEVLLALYDERGFEALPLLNGMFAFALWDDRTGMGYLVRDRLGVKPLYYLETPDRLVFGSELAPLLEALPERPDIDPEAVELYLTLGYVPGPWSIYQGIRKLPPGSILTYGPKGVEIRPWYELPVRGPLREVSDARQQLRTTLEDATRLRLISDRPVGTFLSGGLDSSIVSALAARHVSQPLQTFSITFQGEAMFDESRYSRMVAQHIGSDHHELPVTAQAVQDAIPSVLDGQDEPFADASAVPTWLLCKAARKSIVVALSGDGADELFGGYRKYQGELLQRTWLKLPPAARAVLPALLRHFPEARGERLGEAVRRVRRFLDGVDPDTARRLLGWMTLFSPDAIRSLSSHPGLGSGHQRLLTRIQSQLNRVDDPINQALLVDVGLCLPDQMLVKVDRMSMRHGLEVRSPFLDVRVAELAFQVAGRYKLQPGKGKVLVQDACRDLLPEELFKRPKRGFDLPLSDWLRGPLRSFVDDLLTDPSTLSQPWIDPKALRSLLYAHLSRTRDHTPRLWTALTFLWWLRSQSRSKS